MCGLYRDVAKARDKEHQSLSQRESDGIILPSKTKRMRSGGGGRITTKTSV